MQSHLPLSIGMANVSPSQAFETATSFMTNTNWQSYSGDLASSRVLLWTAGCGLPWSWYTSYTHSQSMEGVVVLVQLAPPEVFWGVPDLAEADTHAPDVKVPAWALVDRPSGWDVPSCACEIEPPASPLDPDGICDWAIPGVPREGTAPLLPPVGELVARLQAAVAELVLVNPVDLPGPVALAEEKSLLALEQALRLHQLRRVADFNVRRLHELESFGSLSAWLRTQTTDVLIADVALAKKLHRYPVIRQGLSDLQLSLAAARRLSAALDTLRRVVDRPDGQIDGQPGEEVLAGVLPHVADLICRCRHGLADLDPLLLAVTAELDAIEVSGDSQLGRLEAAFVLLARHLEPVQLKGCLEQLLGALLPNVLEDRAALAEAKRSLDLLVDYDGSGTRLLGDLTPETAELLHLLLDAELRRDPANSDDTSASLIHRAAGGEEHEPVPDRRSKGQRRHDALRNGLRRYLAADLGGVHHKAPVRISVTVGVELLAQQLGALPARTGSGQLVPGSLLRRWACDSTFVRYLMSLGRKVLETSHTGRTLTAAERQALNIQTDGDCAAAGHAHGHHTPGLVMEPHHVRRWVDDGTTSLADTIWACPGLHHDLHTGKKTIRLKDGRHLNENGWTDPPRQPG